MPPLSADYCKTRYPIVLLHGIAFRNDMILPPWGHVPEGLRRYGASVYLGEADAWNPHAANARMIKTSVEKILADSGAAKVNLIAHSKGGIDARYMISHLGMARKVASLTTIATPHRGTAFADLVAELLPGNNPAYGAVDFLGKLMGDKSPRSRAAIGELSRPYMAKFNAGTPDADGVFYQSYGAKMDSVIDDPLFLPSYEFIKQHEGDNDGMVSTASCHWGNFRGILTGKGMGISHLQITGATGDVHAGINIPEWYAGIVHELKQNGF